MSLVPERMKTVKVVIPKDCSRNLLRFLSSTEDIKLIDIHKTPFDLNSFESNGKKYCNVLFIAYLLKSSLQE